MSTQSLIGYGGYTPEQLQAIVRRAHGERARALRELSSALLAWRKTAAQHAVPGANPPPATDRPMPHSRLTPNRTAQETDHASTHTHIHCPPNRTRDRQRAGAPLKAGGMATGSTGEAHDRVCCAASTTARCTISASTAARSSSFVYGKSSERMRRYQATGNEGGGGVGRGAREPVRAMSRPR